MMMQIFEAVVFYASVAVLLVTAGAWSVVGFQLCMTPREERYEAVRRIEYPSSFGYQITLGVCLGIVLSGIAARLA